MDVPFTCLAERPNFYEGSHKNMQTIHSSDITFPWIKPEKSENFITGEQYMIYPFNSIYSYIQSLPSVPLELCLPNCSWIKCSEAISLKWKTGCVSSKYIWHHAQVPTKELYLSLSIRNCVFPQQLVPFFLLYPESSHFLSLVKGTWRSVTSNLFHSLTPSSI